MSVKGDIANLKQAVEKLGCNHYIIRLFDCDALDGGQLVLDEGEYDEPIDDEDEG